MRNSDFAELRLELRENGDNTLAHTDLYEEDVIALISLFERTPVTDRKWRTPKFN